MSWLSVTVSHAPASLEPVPCPAVLAEVGVGTALCTPEFPLSGPPCLLPLDVKATTASWQVAVPIRGGQQTLGECLGWLPGLLLPPPHWWGGVGRGRVQPAESSMISCPRPALTTASCRRRVGGRAQGEAGAEEGQVGLGRRGGWIPRLQRRPWSDHPGSRDFPQPAGRPLNPVKEGTHPGSPGEGTAASSWAPPSPSAYLPPAPCWAWSSPGPHPIFVWPWLCP